MVETLDFDLDAEEMEVFCQEAEELIQQLDGDLLILEQGGENPEVIQRIFRAAHTLKGSAGSIGHQRMANLTHSMETQLDLLRQGRAKANPALLDVLLEAVDALRLLNQEVTTRQHSGVEPDDLIRRLQSWSSSSGADGSDAVTAGANTGHTDVAGAQAAPGSSQPADGAGQRIVRVTAQISPNSIAPAARALQVLLALGEQGQVIWANPAQDAIERGDNVDRVEVLLATNADPSQLEQHLQYIGELMELRVGSESEPENTNAPEETAKNHPDGTQPIAESGSGKDSALRARQNGSTPKGDFKTVRTSVERLDKLMNLVGELVTDRNRLLQTHLSLRTQYHEADGLSELAQAISHMASITDELQEEVMRARMLPLENVFNKFPRMVRDLLRDIGKQATLEIQGQDTELDRSVIEEISDPLMHLLRNAIDHGIEFPDERRAAGKPPSGTVRLAGRSEGNHIIITVSDDGRGIDLERVRRSAVQKGLISEETAARLNDDETLDLIFAPGLSTARQVTDVSGRGVGMDVVRSNIERLHGTVQVETHPGHGTVFELRLPLTLAIMPVLLVSLCGGTYCVPLSSVTEVLKIDPQTIHKVSRGEIVLWRSRTLPLLRLRQFFRLFDHKMDENSKGSVDGQSLSVVAVHWGDENVGLIVDDLLGQQEIVIKSLGRMIGQTPGISGATILGDGSVALIVDVPSMIKQASR